MCTNKFQLLLLTILAEVCRLSNSDCSNVLDGDACETDNDRDDDIEDGSDDDLCDDDADDDDDEARNVSADGIRCSDEERTASQISSNEKTPEHEEEGDFTIKVN